MLYNRFSIINGNLKIKKIKIIGLMRIRNESLILKDTINHFGQFIDGLIVLDDNSTDNSIEIVKSSKKLLNLIVNKKWLKNRSLEETLHRKILLDIAKSYNPIWVFYSDADERFIGNIYEFLNSKESNKINGIKISLFDAYLTPSDCNPYKKGKLINFRAFFGPERRDILMIWRNNKDIDYLGLDAREPFNVRGKIITKFYCQHYGKSLSIKHWKDTCEYYAKFFPQYSSKWKQRRGKAIHLMSDFGNPLYKWPKVILHSIKIN